MRSVFATTMKKNDESEARGKLKCVFPWSILHENPETTVVVLPRCTDFIGVPASRSMRDTKICFVVQRLRSYGTSKKFNVAHVIGRYARTH